MKGRIIVYSILGCPHCMRAKTALRELALSYIDVRLDLFPHIKEDVAKISNGKRTVPQIFFNETHIGGYDDLQKLIADKPRLNEYIEILKSTPPGPDAPVPPDPETAVKDADPFNFVCEPDECFLLVDDMQKENVVGPKSAGILKKYTKAFKGSEFIEWIKNRGLDEEKAVEIGQTLLDRRFASPAKQGNKFIGDSTLYILTDAEECDALNNGPISECVPKPASEIGKQLRTMILKLYAVFLSSDGKSVDYKGMKESAEFEQYKMLTRELLRVDIETASREEKVAFFVNIYNALVIHATIEKGPPTNLWARYKFFNNAKYIIGTHMLSLQDIENGVLRANRKGVGQFSFPFGKNDKRLNLALDRHEPLVHFALVCGAKSCPPIKTYSAENVYEELKLATKSFLENDDGCQVDLKSKTVSLSAVFKWYQVDFGKDKKELLEWVVDHMENGQKKDDAMSLLTGNSFKIAFMKYDWSTNAK